VADWAQPDLGGIRRPPRIAVLPVAAVEQHGPHLPVGVDSFIAQAYLARVRALLPQGTPALILPVQAVARRTSTRRFPAR